MVWAQQERIQFRVPIFFFALLLFSVQTLNLFLVSFSSCFQMQIRFPSALFIFYTHRPLSPAKHQHRLLLLSDRSKCSFYLFFPIELTLLQLSITEVETIFVSLWFWRVFCVLLFPSSYQLLAIVLFFPRIAFIHRFLERTTTITYNADWLVFSIYILNFRVHVNVVCESEVIFHLKTISYHINNCNIFIFTMNISGQTRYLWLIYLSFNDLLCYTFNERQLNIEHNNRPLNIY